MARCGCGEGCGECASVPASTTLWGGGGKGRGGRGRGEEEEEEEKEEEEGEERRRKGEGGEVRKGGRRRGGKEEEGGVERWASERANVSEKRRANRQYLDACFLKKSAIPPLSSILGARVKAFFRYLSSDVRVCSFSVSTAALPCRCCIFAAATSFPLFVHSS
jgi:hypothetical protein